MSINEHTIRNTIINSMSGRTTFLSSQLTLNEYKSLVEYAGKIIPKNARVLDIGCGIGYSTSLLSLIRKDITIIGVDPFNVDSWKPLSNKFKTNIIKADGLRIPIKKKSIDFVLSFGVIEHVPSDITFLKEIKRILKPGGKNVMFHIPNKYALNEYLAKKAGLGHHELKYRPEEIRQLLEKAGFRMISWKYDYLLPLQFYKLNKGLNSCINKYHRAVDKTDKILVKTPLKHIAESFSVVSVSL